jgi:hypothetical protein
MYVKKYYGIWLFEPVTLEKISVWGKRYESCRKMLWTMATRNQIREVSRERRENGSDKILFTITKLWTYMN